MKFISCGPEETVRHMTILGTLTSGALSGIAAKTLVYPLDVAKKRMQIQNMEEMRAPHFGKVCLFSLNKEKRLMIVNFIFLCH